MLDNNAMPDVPVAVMRTQRDRAVALLREVCETSYDDLAALRGNINAACDWLESLEEGGS